MMNRLAPPEICAEPSCRYMSRWGKFCPLHAKEHAKQAQPQAFRRG